MSGARGGMVLVTGAGGYLGGRIALRLLEAGRSVRLASRTPGSLPPALAAAEAVEFPGDFSARALRDACRGVDTVVHAAALNEKSCAADPAAAARVNTVGTVALLRAAEQEGVARFVYLSTAYVYGAQLTGEVTEASPVRPQDAYSISHRGAEDYVLAAHDQRRVVGAALRLSSAVGAPVHAGVDRWSLMTNQLCRQAVTERRVELQSPGLQWRDFVPIADVCGAVECVASLPREAVGDGVFNVGRGESLRVADFADLVARRCAAALGFAPRVVRPNAPAGAPLPAGLTFRVDRLRAAGWAPAATLEDEIDATLALCAKSFAGGSQ